MSETTGSAGTPEPEQRDREREDPSIAGKPEVTAMDDDVAASDEADIPTGRTEEREQRRHGVQQHGDTFLVDDEPTDAGAGR